MSVTDKGASVDNVRSKIVAITGAASGIGAATARLLADRGATVVLGARRKDRLAALTGEITQRGGSAAWVRTDVTRRADLEALVGSAVERFGRLDVLVSNAGIGPIGPLDDLRTEEWDAMIDTNIRGLLHGIAAALPVFRAQRSGHFVNVISTAGLRIVPDQVVYAATKNAARTITEGLRQEAGPDLRVTGVSPGFVATDFADSISDPQVRAGIRDTARRIAIAPEAVAEAIAFAVGQPATVDVGDIVVRPTAQS